MHPRSPFNTPTVFADLAKEYPDFSNQLNSHYINQEAQFLTLSSVIYPSSLNFKDPEAVRSLAKCLLHRHFGLEVMLREDRLCPMIPNRFDYVLWLQDLIDETGKPPPSKYDPQRTVVGLDIGTGSCAIYPLLACATRKHWNMYGTDIDKISYETALQNVSKNTDVVNNRINIYFSHVDGPVIPLDDLGLDSIDFVMCNPPFYSSKDEMLASAELKDLPPLTTCTGTQIEMVHAPDGEIGFTRRMLSESLKLRSRVQWYTTLCGKLATVQMLVKDISAALGPSGNWAVTQFTQGTTRRWAVGWSFCGWRPRMTTCSVHTASLSGCLPFAPEFAITSVGNTGEQMIYEILKSVPALTKSYCDDPPGIYCEFSGNVWSRAWRRAALRGAANHADTGVRMGVLLKTEESRVVISWIYGEDRVLYESFCEMIRRKVVM